MGHERARPARGLGAASRSCAVTEAVFANTRVVPASARVGALLVVNVKARDRRARFLEQSTARREFARGRQAWRGRSLLVLLLFAFSRGTTIGDGRRPHHERADRDPSATLPACASHRRAATAASFLRSMSLSAAVASAAPSPHAAAVSRRLGGGGGIRAAARAPRARRSP